jgi:hypothetical protein
MCGALQRARAAVFSRSRFQEMQGAPQQQQYAAGHISGLQALAKLELMFSCSNLKNMVRDAFLCPRLLR